MLYCRLLIVSETFAVGLLTFKRETSYLITTRTVGSNGNMSQNEPLHKFLCAWSWRIDLDIFVSKSIFLFLGLAHWKSAKVTFLDIHIRVFTSQVTTLIIKTA